jgi:hypothetical protein
MGAVSMEAVPVTGCASTRSEIGHHFAMRGTNGIDRIVEHAVARVHSCIGDSN